MSKQLKYNVLKIIVTTLLLTGKPPVAFAQSTTEPLDTTCLRMFNLALDMPGNYSTISVEWYPAAGKNGKDDYVFGSYPLVKAMVEYATQHPEMRFTLDIYTKGEQKGFNTVKMTKITADVIRNFLTRSGVPPDRIVVSDRGKSDSIEIFDNGLTMIFTLTTVD